MGKIRSSQLAYETALMDPELVFRSIGFTNFLSTWLIRRVDPKGLHPATPVEYVSNFLFERISSLNVFGRLPLPKEVPMDFRVLPEYIVEDIVGYLFFAVQYVLSRAAPLFRPCSMAVRLTEPRQRSSS
jgi:ubiquitin conjugation factor E4 B